jgi:hypothetical protein
MMSVRWEALVARALHGAVATAARSMLRVGRAALTPALSLRERVRTGTSL